MRPKQFMRVALALTVLIAASAVGRSAEPVKIRVGGVAPSGDLVEIMCESRDRAPSRQHL